MHYVQIPDGVLELQKELLNPHWHELQSWLISEARDMVGITNVIGLLAARMGIVLDGEYDIPVLCKTLAEELLRRRRQAEAGRNDTSRLILPPY